MNDYRQLAIKDLEAHGLTAKGLIERYPQELKRFKLACDMGETGILLAPIEPTRDPLEAAAYAWLDLAATWPPKACIEGIDLPILFTAFATKVNANGMALKDIPQSLQSEEIKIAAARQDGWALTYIPADQQSEALRLVAVNQDGRSLRYIPAESQSEAVRLAAVSKDAWALEFIPEDLQSEAVRRAALIKDRSAARFMPDKVAARLFRKLELYSLDPSP